MKKLIFLLEEPSAKEMLKEILPRMLPVHIHTDFKVFEGKQDLEKRLPIILRAWQIPNCSFVVLRDQDSGKGNKSGSFRALLSGILKLVDSQA